MHLDYCIKITERRLVVNYDEKRGTLILGFSFFSKQVVVTKKAVVVSEETRVVNGRDPDLIGKIIGNFTEEVTGGLEDLESPNTDSGISSVRICQSQTL